MVTVTWSAGPGGHAESYRVETWDTTGVGMWTDDNRQPVTDPDSTGADTYTGPGVTATDGAMRIRVVATDTLDVEYPSATVTVAAIDPSPSNVKARRNIDAQPDSLEVTWDAKGNDDSKWRILVKFGTETAWYVADDTDVDGGAWGVTVDTFGGETLQAVATGGMEKAMTPALAGGAMTFRVDYRQGDSVEVAGVETNPWKPGGTATVAAKPAG